MNNTTLGYLVTFGAAAAFAALSVFTKLAYDLGMNAWSFTVLNSLPALPILLVMLVREKKGQRLKAQGQSWAILLLAVCGAASGILFSLALYHLSISLVSILFFSYPAVVGLIAWLMLGQRPTLWQGIALILTLAGVVLTNVNGMWSGDVDVTGIALALAGSLAQGVYMVLGERLSEHVSAVAATTFVRVGMLVGALLMHPAAAVEAVSVPAQGWLIGVVSAVVCGVVPFLFILKGINLLGASRAAIISVSELPFALTLGLLVQGDVVLPVQWVGAILIGAAVLISQRQDAPQLDPDNL